MLRTAGGVRGIIKDVKMGWMKLSTMEPNNEDDNDDDHDDDNDE